MLYVTIRHIRRKWRQWSHIIGADKYSHSFPFLFFTYCLATLFAQKQLGSPMGSVVNFRSRSWISSLQECLSWYYNKRKFC